MLSSIAEPLAYVLIIMIIAATAITVFAMFLRASAAETAAKLNPKKRTIVPNKAYAQPGICTCDDGFNFHIDGGRCNVEGCPCVVYIASTTEPEVLKEIEAVGINRLAIESANTQQEALGKLQRLEARKASINAIEAPAQIGAKNKGKQCPECLFVGDHQVWCSKS